MKKNFIAKIAVLAAAIVAIAVWVYAHSYKVSEPPKFETEFVQEGETVSVEEYELKRAVLYDAALNLCMVASDGSYVWENCVSEENKCIILNYRVPSLEVLLSAIAEMDSDGCLCDSFDEPLIAFDNAFSEYSKIVKIK